MNGLAVAALVLACVWLGFLTLVVVLLVRQIGLLTVRLSVTGQAQAFALDNDGPEVGSTVPEEVVSALPEVGGERAYVLLSSATCTPCRELVAGIRHHDFEQAIVALVPGPEELADELAALLPPGVRAVLNPEATELAQALGIRSTPFVVEVERGTVTRKAYLYRGASDLFEFVDVEPEIPSLPKKANVTLGSYKGRDGRKAGERSD
jgi:hypothetical protein